MHNTSINGSTEYSTLPRAKSSGSRKCNCCPYGYHLDLDFVRYCEKVANSQLLPNARHTISRTKVGRKKRESMSIESLLGLSPPPTQHIIKERSLSLQNGTQEKTDKFSDELAKAVSDFEKMFNSSLKANSVDTKRKEETNTTEFDTNRQSKRGVAADKTVNYTDDARLHLNGINNEIREQMASSLKRMKELEEEVKRIPNLQNQVQKLRWENRRLTKLLETETEEYEHVKKNIKAPEVKEDSIRHTRTIGTGCTVLRRDVATWDPVMQATIGTNTVPPVKPIKKTFVDSKTNTDHTLQYSEFITEPHKQSKKNIKTHQYVQANILPIVVPTKQSFSQTDNSVLKVSTHDASVQHSPFSNFIHSHNFGCQVDIRKSKRITSDKGVQLEKNPCISVITQTESTLLKIPATKDFGCQVKVPTHIIKKDLGIQIKPHLVDIATGPKSHSMDNASQTPRLQKRDIGISAVVHTPETTNAGTNTEIKKQYESTPALISKVVDTYDLCKKVEVSVSAKPNHVNKTTDTQDLKDNKKNDTFTKTGKDYPKTIKSEKPQAVKHDPVHNLRETFEKELSTEEVGKSVSPSVSVITKPYEKKEPSKEMKGALKVLNDSLQKSPSGDMPKGVRNAVNIIQQEWFKISSTAEANPLDVEDYLDCFEEFSVGLLEYIVNMTDVSGNTAMHYAVSNGNFDVVSILLDSKVCNINKLNTAGYTCIMLVALAKVKSSADRQVVRRLFHMADLNIRAKQHGQTALMLAVSHGRIDTVELLIESGADINIQDEDGSTALMCAAEHGYIDIVKLLLTNPDCDLTIADLDGNTALNIAIDTGNRDIGVLLYAQEHFRRGSSPFSTLKGRKSKSSTPTLKTTTPTPPNCSQEHSL